MEDTDWTPAYSTITQHLPTLETPLNFYLHCETHKVQLDTLASLNKRALLHRAKKRVKCRWTCGHCAHIFPSSMEMRRHLSLFSVHMGYAKSAEFATPKMANLPSFRQKSHIFKQPTLQIMANNARRAHLVPRYNALLNYHLDDILRLSAEAAELRKPSFSHSQILYSPISPAQPVNFSFTEFSNSFSSNPQILPEETSSEMGIDALSPIPTKDVTSTVRTSARTWENLAHQMSHLQDMRLKLSHTLNFQSALLQKQPSMPLTHAEQQMLQHLLCQHILPLPFTSSVL